MRPMNKTVPVVRSRQTPGPTWWIARVAKAWQMRRS